MGSKSLSVKKAACKHINESRFQFATLKYSKIRQEWIGKTACKLAANAAWTGRLFTDFTLSMSKRYSCSSKDLFLAKVWLSYRLHVMLMWGYRAQTACSSGNKEALLTFAFQMARRGSVAAASRRRMIVSLPSIRRDVERCLDWWNMAMWIGRSGTGWSTWALDSATPNIFASVTEQVDLDGMKAIDGNRRGKIERNEHGSLGTVDG